MRLQTKQRIWAVIHQVLLLFSVILFPLVVVLERLGVPVSETVSEFIDTINTKYRKASDDDVETTD